MRSLLQLKRPAPASTSTSLTALCKDPREDKALAGISLEYMLALVDKLVEDRLEDTEGVRMLGKAADMRLWAGSRLLGLLCTQSGRPTTHHSRIASALNGSTHFS